VPRPGEDKQRNDLGAANLEDVATNAGDIPRSAKDGSGGADVVTGTGDTLPSTVDSKRLFDAGDSAAKGNVRDAKKEKQKGGDDELGAADQAEAYL